MTGPSRSTLRRRPRWGTLVVVCGIHLLVIAGLVRVFAPGFTTEAAQQVASMLVTVSIRETPSPTAASDTPDTGGAAPQGVKARPLPISAPEPIISTKPTAMPEAAATAVESTSGAAAAGESAGGGGAGARTGNGDSGTGQGNGAATRPVLISGSINAAKDFPIPPGGREARVGRSVIVALTVGVDGVPSACRIYQASGLSQTDQRTCELAMTRLRFRPATNARGEPVISTFYWQQRFFD